MAAPGSRRTRLAARYPFASDRTRGRQIGPGPHELLPWSIAGLIAMFWLTPFDRHPAGRCRRPINITLDRVVLPIIAVIWLIAFAVRPVRASRPRLRITRVHVAIGDLPRVRVSQRRAGCPLPQPHRRTAISVKKVPLLVSYMSVFVIVASSVRRSEVPAFLTYTLILAVIVAVGVVYEYRSNTNVFTSLAEVAGSVPRWSAPIPPTHRVLDSLGRRWVAGPAAYGVELVLMLSIAPPDRGPGNPQVEDPPAAPPLRPRRRGPALRHVRDRSQERAGGAGCGVPDDGVLPTPPTAHAGAARSRDRGDRDRRLAGFAPEHLLAVHGSEREPCGNSGFENREL